MVLANTMTMIARVWRIVLVAAFLLAQASALAHPIWHSGTANSALTSLSSSDVDDGKGPRDAPLCNFHTALGAVLGALSGSFLAAEPVKSSYIEVVAVDFPAVSLAALPPASRGPPLHP